MNRWQMVFPMYNLASNKGYSTPDHLRALREHGPTTLHRFSFEPVRMSCPQIWWSGYRGDAVQQDLFAAPGAGEGA
jgi:ribonuclease HII